MMTTILSTMIAGALDRLRIFEIPCWLHGIITTKKENPGFSFFFKKEAEGLFNDLKAHSPTHDRRRIIRPFVW